jgi:hypothetical protein
MGEDDDNESKIAMWWRGRARGREQEREKERQQNAERFCLELWELHVHYNSRQNCYLPIATSAVMCDVRGAECT